MRATNKTNYPVQESNNMQLEILKQFGLTNNDIKVYSSLLRIGRSKTGPIIQAAGVASSRVYESLRLLAKKGLVSYEVKNNIKYYKAELPDQLIESAERNTIELKQLTKEIRQVPIVKQDRNDTNTYEGIHGFKRAFIQHMESIEKNEHVGVIAFSNHTVTRTKFGQLNKLFAEVDNTLFSKTENVRMLLDKSLHQLLKENRKHFAKYTLKFLPPGYFSPVAVNISKKEIMLSVWGSKPTVFTMKNPVVIESFQKNFEFLWALAKR